jgi:Domain of unknown function (DUF1707)
MPAPYNPPWGRGSSGRRASQANPAMRVSHAERTEVADRLSKHYGDGRLDEEEFNERLDRAMKAKTQSDLDGLFDDLPEPELPRQVARPDPRPRPRPSGPRSFPRIAFLALVVIIAIMVGQWLARPFIFPFAGFWPLGFHIPWLLIGIVVFVWWRFARWHRR